MRRMIVAAVIFALILTAWSVEKTAVNKICNGMVKNVEKLKNTREEDLPDVISEVDKDWEKGTKVLEMLIPHDDTDEINVDWACYKSRIRGHNYTGAIYVLDEMSQHFKEIEGKTKVNMQNIF